MESDSGEESDIVFTQRSRERHRTMAGHVISPDGVVQPAGSSMEHGAEATSTDAPGEGASVEHYADSEDEEGVSEAKEIITPWMRIGLRIEQENERVEQEKKERLEQEEKKRVEVEQEQRKRGHRHSSLSVKEARLEEGEIERGSKSRGVKRGRGTAPSDPDADLDSSGEEQSTASEEDKGERGLASKASKRQQHIA